MTTMKGFGKKALGTGMVAAFTTMLALVMAPTGAAAGACPLMILKCGCTISSSGSYTLAGLNPMLLTSTEGSTCIHITASDVTLTGGPTLKGPGSTTSTYGVHIGLYANKVTLQSVAATYFGQGIRIDGPNAIVQQAATSFNNKGTVVNGAHALLVDQSSQRDEAVGIQVNDTAKNFAMVESAADEATGTGIELNGVKGAFLNSIVTDEDGDFGIWLKNASNNFITGFESEDNGIAGVYLGCNAAGPNGKACPISSNGNTLTGAVYVLTDSIVSDTGNILLPQQSYGIAVGKDNLQNHLFGITGTGNVVKDALDENPNCGTNRWSNDSFTTSSPAKNTTLTCIN